MKETTLIEIAQEVILFFYVEYNNRFIVVGTLYQCHIILSQAELAIVAKPVYIAPSKWPRNPFQDWLNSIIFFEHAYAVL